MIPNIVSYCKVTGIYISGVRIKKRRNIYARHRKIIHKMRRQPNGIRFQELAKVLEYNGYTMKPKKRNFTPTFHK